MKQSLSKMRCDLKLIYKKNEVLAYRLSALIEFEKINIMFKGKSKAGKRMKLLSLVQGLEVSERTLYRWRSSYLSNDLFGLIRKKSKGAKKEEINEEIQKIIELMRSQSHWGPEVIHHHLRLDYGHEVSIYRINKFLNESGLRAKYPLRKVYRNQRKKKHTKKVVVRIPGAHTQMDVNHQRHILREKSYIYNFVDHATNWSFKRAYFRVCPSSTVDFMRRLVKVCPFKILRLQTDNGTEFTYKYISKYQDDPKEHPLTSFCKKNKIQHHLIPPGEKELQGLVERSHRQDKEELLHRLKVETLDEFNGELSYYNDQRNKMRRFKKLGWIAPIESMDSFLINTIAVHLFFKEKKVAIKRRKYRKKKIKNVLELNTKDQKRIIRKVLSTKNVKKAG